MYNISTQLQLPIQIRVEDFAMLSQHAVGPVIEIELDPTQIMNEPQYHEYWKTLFFTQSLDHLDASMIYRKHTFDENGNPTGEVINLKVKQDIIRYANKRGEPRFLIKGPKISHGSYGIVYAGLAKIKLTDFNSPFSYQDYTNNPKYVIKEQNHNNFRPIEKAEAEAKITAKLFDLRGKYPLLSIDQERSFIIQRYIPGKELRAVLWEESFTPSLNTDDLLRLTRLLFKSYKEQMREIINGDVKPENMLFDKTRWGLVLVDTGHAFEAENAASNVSNGGGTELYFAPEYWKERKANKETDTFAIGVTAFQLWNRRQLISEQVEGDCNSTIVSLKSYYKELKEQPTNSKNTLDDLCKKIVSICVAHSTKDTKDELLKAITELSKAINDVDLDTRYACILEKLKIIKSDAMEDRARRYHEEQITVPHDLNPVQTDILKMNLEQMTSPDPQARSVDTGMIEIEKIIFQRKLANTSATRHTALTTAYNKATELNFYINMFGTAPITNLTLTQGERIKSLANHLLSKVEDSPDAINQFVETLDIEAVTNAPHTTKNEVERCIATAIDTYFKLALIFHEIYQKVREKKSTMNPSVLGQKIENRIVGFINSYGDFLFTFDRMVFITKRLEKELSHLQPMYLQFQQQESMSYCNTSSNLHRVTPPQPQPSTDVYSENENANKTSQSALGNKRKVPIG